MTHARPILLVEDDGIQRETLCDFLSDDGDYHVVGAASLREAAAAYNANPTRFDAILLDALLPDGDGQTFCVWLRRSGYTAPIIMLSGGCSEAAAGPSIAAGASEYVQKPVRVRTLMACLKRHLNAVEQAA